MKKIITCILAGVACLMPHKQSVEYPDIYEAINACEKIEITIDGNVTQLNYENCEYEAILNELNKMLEESHEMPAFGVSLDHETKESKKSGVWLELKYSETIIHNEMPFDSLLIQVEKDWSGFNIYRGNKGVYEGRCYYIDLVDNNMDNLYDLLITCPQN